MTGSTWDEATAGLSDTADAVGQIYMGIGDQLGAAGALAVGANDTFTDFEDASDRHAAQADADRASATGHFESAFGAGPLLTSADDPTVPGSEGSGSLDAPGVTGSWDATLGAGDGGDSAPDTLSDGSWDEGSGYAGTEVSGDGGEAGEGFDSSDLYE